MHSEAALRGYARLFSATASPLRGDGYVVELRDSVVPLKNTKVMEMTTWPRGLGAKTSCMLKPKPNTTNAQQAVRKENIETRGV